LRLDSLVRPVLLLLLSLVLPPSTLSCTAPPSDAEKGGDLSHPNIVFFLADDMGIGDTSAYQDWTGNADAVQLHTPGIDRLARMGIRFTDAHSPSSVCTPTRYAFLTGRYSWRTSLKHKVLFGPMADPLIERERVTLPEILRSAGYSTALVGKWHLGLTYSRSDGRAAGSWKEADLRLLLQDGPLDHGFDYAFFTARSHLSSSSAGWFENRRAINSRPEGPKIVSGYDMSRTGEMNFRHARKFLDGHFAGPQRDRPFFLYYAANSNHTPYTPSRQVNETPVLGHSRNLDGGTAGDRGDFIYENDAAVQELLGYLEEHDDPRRPGRKLMENTLFIFTSDNGSELGGRVSVGPLRGMKERIHEGGHRVPFVALWIAGGVGDGDSSTPGLSSGYLFGLNDMYGTFAELTGQSLPGLQEGGEDSQSILGALRPGGRAIPSRDAIVLHDDASLGPALAIREGPWKLIVSSDLIWRGVLVPIALFNLDENLQEAESGNLLRDPAQAERVKDLSAKLARIFFEGHSRHAPSETR
jgi:arylsulfatase A-like enzyme